MACRKISVMVGDKTVRVMKAYSFLLQACTCEANCGNVNLILEDDDGKAFAIAQIGYDQIFDGFVEAAQIAMEKAGVKAH